MAGRMEREMNRSQRGLVDTCFEEGQYEAGIAILDQLRSPHYRPSQSHIRQLLFLALYPPLPEADEKENYNNEHGSPSKLDSGKYQKATLLPSRAASEAACRLLHSFAGTNSPGALLSALPNYSNRASDTGLTENYDDDCYIAQEASCIGNARHCWSILEESFIQRKRPGPSTPKEKGRRRKWPSSQDETLPARKDAGQRCLVSQYAWPVLDWVLRLFEQDELDTETTDLPRHSPLLLSYIPPPKSKSGPRWEADQALNLVFYCLHQQSERRKVMGIRLLTMLTNLTSTTYFDLQMFTTQLHTRICDSEVNIVEFLFEQLPCEPPILRFRIMLCKRYLTVTPSGVTGDNPRSQPKPKAMPSARAVRVSDGSRAGQEDSTPQKATEANSVVRKIPIPSGSEVRTLIERKVGTFKASELARIKYELILAYGLLHNHDTGAEDDVSWNQMIRDGSLATVLQTTFAEESLFVFKEALLSMLTEW